MTQPQLKPDQLDLTTVLSLTGGTLTGPLTLNADPTTSLQAATKQYVDSHAGGGGGGTTTFGLYSARPSASTLGAGNSYVGTDTMETYYSNGTSYTVLPGGSAELGYAEIVSSATGSTSGLGTLVPGLVFTFVAPERPVMLELNGVMALDAGITVGNVSLRVDGTEYTSCANEVQGSTTTLSRQVRVGSFTPGTSHTVTLALIATSGTGNVTLYATSIDAFFIRATTT